MTKEEVAARDAVVPEPTDAEIAEVFCTYAMWDYEPSYYRIAKVARAAGAARGLSPEAMRALGRGEGRP